MPEHKSMYVSTLNIQVSIYRCWQAKYTHFVEPSSTGFRDMLGHSRGKLCHRERGRCLARHQIYHRTVHRFVYYRVPPGSSPILANFSIRKLSGTITLDWKGLFSIRKKPLVAKDLFFRFDTRVGAVSGGAGAWLGPKSVFAP